MRILRLVQADDGAIRGCFDVWEAARRADDPFRPPESLRVFQTDLFSVWDGSPAEVWYAPGAEDSVAGWYMTVFPDQQNLRRGILDVRVHPARRGAGLGTALLRHAAGRAAANGRTVLGGGVREGSAGEAWMRRLGATLGPADVRRVQDLRKVQGAAVAWLRKTAAEAAAGYSLVRWAGITPDSYLGHMAALQNAMNDAPRGDGVEPYAWDALRIRERFDAWVALSARRRYSVAAVHEATGEMAALTAVSVDPDIPEWGRQWATTVTRPHRGHRLGLLVKTEMMSWLAQAEPRLERIATLNAASNQHMIGINEALGYEVAGHPYRSVDLPVGSAPPPERYVASQPSLAERSVAFRSAFPGSRRCPPRAAPK
jgi:GNAT superfamily N-acetyltransferase